MNFELITEANFLLYATKCYDNPQCHSVEEFNEDIRRFASAKRLFLRLYRKRDSINERMLLNHLIIINNLFGNLPSARMMFIYCPPETHTLIATFYRFLSILPNSIPEVNLSDVPTDEDLINRLNSLI